MKRSFVAESLSPEALSEMDKEYERAVDAGIIVENGNGSHDRMVFAAGWGSALKWALMIDKPGRITNDRSP